MAEADERKPELTRAQIDALTGEELNDAIAERVFGWKALFQPGASLYSPPVMHWANPDGRAILPNDRPRYSSDTDAAMSVLCEARGHGSDRRPFKIGAEAATPDSYWCWIGPPTTGGIGVTADGVSISEAICRAALALAAKAAKE